METIARVSGWAELLRPPTTNCQYCTLAPDAAELLHFTTRRRVVDEPFLSSHAATESWDSVGGWARSPLELALDSCEAASGVGTGWIEVLSAES
eukprot:COSAG04_NODE_17492_length_468_cov_0.677507_1_plen_93_part_10